MRTTAIMNQKGGTAKTVTAINTAAILARDYGHRVLLVDADSQANLTEFVQDENQIAFRVDVHKGLADLLKGFRVLPWETKMLGVKLLPATDDLMDLDVSKAGSGEADVMALAEFLEENAENYDTVLIDCPPAFNAAAIAALVAADDVVIPMKLDAFSIRGLANMLHQVACMKKINTGLEIAGVLPTMWRDDRDKSMTKAEEKIRLSGLNVFPHIRYSPMKVDRSTFEQRALIYSSPKCAACRDYRSFAQNYLGASERGCDPDGV